MNYRLLIFAATSLLYTTAIWAQDLAQEPEEDLPPVSELLDRAAEHIESLEPDLEQADLYCQLSALFARSQDMDSAYRVLRKIQIPKSSYPHTTENQKRVGFLELVEDVALHRDAQIAIEIVTDCPAEFRAYRDDAFGRVALSASRRRDAEGAWKAISKINQPQGLYPYELIAAATLVDKVRAKRILLERHKDVITAINDNTFMSREQWFGILWVLSFYKWCELKDESEELLDVACKTTDAPDKTRASLLKRLDRPESIDANPTHDHANQTQVTRKDIAQMAASIDELKTPKEKSERLLRIAKYALEFGRQPIVGDCD